MVVPHFAHSNTFPGIKSPILKYQKSVIKISLMSSAHLKHTSVLETKEPSCNSSESYSDYKKLFSNRNFLIPRSDLPINYI